MARRVGTHLTQDLSTVSDSARPTPDQPVVMVVEDDQNLADLYATWLDDYTVKTAYDGEAALKQIDRRVDVVLLDRRMPGQSGDEVLGRIRERGFDCQVAMVTAVEPDFDILKLDIDDYLTKPIEKDALRSTVQNLLERGGLEQELQTYMALAEKKTALEQTKAPEELETHTEYGILTEQLAERRERLSGRLESVSGSPVETVRLYQHRLIARDGFGIVLLAAGLVAVHWDLPDAAVRLGLDSAPQPGLLAAFLGTFVHFDTAHLVGNVANYLVVASVAYYLSLRLRAARWFYLTTAMLLTVLPFTTVALSRTTYAVLFPETTPVFLGFSDVVAGFIGFAYLGFLLRCRTLYDLRTVFFIGVLLPLATATVQLRTRSGLALTLGAGVVLLGGLIVREIIRSVPESAESRRDVFDQLAVLAVAIAFFAAMGFRLVPTITPGSAAGTGIVGHLLGVVGGVGLGLVTAILTNTVPVRERLAAPESSISDR